MKVKINLDDYNAKPDKTIKQHNDELIEQLNILKALGYIKDEKLYELLQKACYYHDIGKVNQEFQKRVNSEKKLRFDDTKEVVHNVLSLCFLDKSDFQNEEDFYSVAHTILQHHNYGNVFDIINNNGDLINKLLEPFNITKPKRSLINKLSTDNNAIDDRNVLVKGFLHKCDYSASAGYQVEYKNDFLLDSLENLHYKWNNVQKFCIENRDNNIIAIASTGAGKTEAGLLWLENNKSFFILPLRTAINAMYDRIKKNILNNIDIAERISILHSSSLDYYNKNNGQDDSEEVGNIDFIEYENRGKRLSIPLNISTMDQLFDFVFKYNGYELKLATLSYSKIVIDEIQMYSANLLAYLIYGIDSIIEVGGKVAIVTATFPPFIYDLMDKDKTKFVKQDFLSDETQKPRHNIKVMDNELNAQDIIDKYYDNKNNNTSSKILVVCNTVKKAQQIYQQLCDSKIFGEQELNILHSRFIKKERLVKENQISKCGQTYNNDGSIDKQSCIWISTSLVEASLDIDFDYLFTELQDLNSLFQRLGRVNRKGVKDNSSYNCFIYTDIDKALLKDVKSKKGFIDKKMFELSKQALENVDGLITEKKKVELINCYLTTDNLKNSSYMDEYHETYAKIKELPPYYVEKTDIDLRHILSESIMPSPVYLHNKDYIDGLINEYNNCLHSISKLRKELAQNNSSDKTGELKKLELLKNKLSSDINDNMVDVPNHHTFNRCLFTITLGDKRKIKIIDCEYDKKGYIKIDPNKQPSQSNIL